MKAINLKQLATFSFAALLLASCSDSNNEAGNADSGAAKTSVVGKEVTSITDAQTLAARVFNFNTAKSSTSNARTRASVNVPSVTKLTMPSAPTPTGTEITNITQNTGSGNYIIKSKITTNEFANFSNTNIYIENGGELTITNVWNLGDNVNIYVLNGGKLNYEVYNLYNNIYSYKGSTLKATKGIYISSGKGLYIEGDWTTSTDIDNRGNFYIGGAYCGSKFYPAWGSTSTFSKSLTLNNELSVEAPIYVGGDLNAPKVKISSESYVVGNVKLSNDLTVAAPTYIGGNLNAQKVNISSESYIVGNADLSNDFDVNAPTYIGGNLTAKNLYFGSQIQIDGNVDIGSNTYKTDTENSNVYIGGNLKCGDFYNNQSSTTNVQGEDGLDLSDKKITINGTVSFAGKFKANELYIEGTSDFYACGVETTGEFRINSNTSTLHTGYLKAASIYQIAQSKIYLNPNGYIDCEGTYENTNNGVGFITLTGDNSVALFKANRVKYNGSNDYTFEGTSDKFSTCYIFNAESENSVLYLDVKEFEDNGTVLTDMNKVPRSGKNGFWSEVSSNYTIADTKCGKTIKPNSDPTPDPTPGPVDPVTPDNPDTDTKKKLVNISDIVYDHDHDISATCIKPYNGKMYMSYHTRGEGHGACIEVFETKKDETQQDKTTLLQYLQDKDQVLDFNHLMIDDKATTPQLYVVGNSFKSGGIMARIDIKEDGLLNTDVKEFNDETPVYPLSVVPLVRNVQKGTTEAGYDENCIVRDGDKLLIMSTRGYEVYDPNTLTSLGNKPTPGKAKHIAITGNDMATLYYKNGVTTTEEAVDGIIETFNTGDDILTATPKETFEVGKIAPNNGKNTIAIDGNYIYVCRSEKGLSCFDRTTGEEKWNWTAPLTSVSKVPQGYANGVTFDDQYIYLACGGYGLVVLDKNNMTDEGKPAVVAKKRATTGNSANYVYVYNGYIYVAYGKSRIQVFKLIDNTVNTGGITY